MMDRLKLVEDPVADDLESTYSVGKSQNQPINLALFLTRNHGDPAITVGFFLACLIFKRAHPVPRVLLRNSRIIFYREFFFSIPIAIQ
jgi:hypothetical protein